MYISYDTKKGIEYAKLCCSHWVDGRDKKTYTNLGRVINKNRHIYKNRQRGLYHLDPKTGEYTLLDEAEFSTGLAEHSRSLSLMYGDAWFIDQYLRKTGLDNCIKAVKCSCSDTVFALVQFYILNHLGLDHAQDWYNHSYASILYPEAKLTSQRISEQLAEKRISEQLAEIGSEESFRSFFKSYISFMKATQENLGNILIDSTGLPNSIHFPLTGISNHNGKVSNEVRLIFVTQKKTGIPIYFRYVQGTIPDVTTIFATLKELKANGIAVDEALLDAGYYLEKNVHIFYKEKVHFVCRMKENLTLFKQLAAEYKNHLETSDNMVKFGKRIVFIQHKAVELAPGCPGYAYVCLDVERRAMQTQKYLDHLDPKEKPSYEEFESIESEGLFVLVSSVELSNDEILPIYYTRQQIEQTFDVSKNSTNLLPIRVATESNFRGHLLLTFIAVSIVKRIQNILLSKTKKRGKRINIVTLFQNLGYQHCLVYQDKIIVHEADSIANKGYEMFKIECPHEIEI